MKTITTFALALTLALCPTLAAADEAKDSIEILHVAPEQPLERGVEVELTVDVEAVLESAHEGVVWIGFNTTDPAAMRMIDQRKIQPGAQQLTFVVEVVPVDWQERGDFQVMVNMGPPPTESSWRPTASDTRTLELQP